MKIFLLSCLLACVAVASPPAPEPVWDVVRVMGRDDITHAKVKKVLPDGILFRCDQGLVKARFEQLAPEFQATYGDDAQRAAVKDYQTKKETVAIMKDRMREEEWFAGNVISQKDGIVLLDCGYEDRTTSYYTTANERNKRRIYGVVAVKDDGTFAIAQVRYYYEIVGRRCDDVTTSNGQALPCYTVVSLEKWHQ